MSRVRSFSRVAAVLLCGACVSGPMEGRVEQPEARAPWDAPALERRITVLDGRTGEPSSLAALLDELAAADVVFLGESHIDETTHHVEQAVYEGLLARREGNVVLALEMFERDVQEHLDAYLAGETDEATFLQHARPWSNYRTAYRPLIERARQDGLPVIAANFPLMLRRRMSMGGGPKVLEALEGDARRQAPREFLPNSPAYWRRVDNAIRGHMGMMRARGGGTGGDEERLYATQSLWDNSMGEACADALDAHPGALVLHVNGGFHSEYWDGTVRQLQLRKPDALVKTVSILSTSNPSVAGVSGAPWADHVVFAESRAADLNEGTWSVQVSRPHKYRLRLPKGATDDAPVGLLIWLGDDGLTAKDGMDLWKARLGGDVALAILEAPYRETQEDLGVGGRWFWPETFPADVGAMHGAIGRIWGYLLRNFPIDPTRVCLAGEGTGATIVAATALMTERMDLTAVALSPRRYAKIKDFPLPLPEFRGDAPPRDKSLRVIAPSGDEEWWADELEAYAGIGFDSAFVTLTDDPWEIERSAENALRVALGLEEQAAPDDAARKYVLVEQESPRARHWARLVALKNAVDGAAVAVLDEAPDDTDAQAIPIAVTPESLSKPGAIPLCPGPFGGTTVLALPEGATPEQIEAWLALEKNDPLSKRSRFHRVRISTATGDLELEEVLERLEAKNRKNVLILPATFCADAATMRRLKRAARDCEDRMTLHWLPGLGASAAGVKSGH